ncbi:MAG: ABC transporter permease [Gemmobacter sp.]|jgi:peptide/nickel transport system permease protein|nr:ABC transporter permease [Gemmobacter sp.]
MSMFLRITAQRIAFGIMMLLMTSVIIFAGIEILPGDVAQAMLGQSATPDTVAQLRLELGLDRPAIVRFGEWLTNAIQGDFGRSYTNKLDIASEIAHRLKNTLLLAAGAALISIPLALFLGLLGVLYSDGIVDRVTSILVVGGISVPEFFMGYILIFVFAVGWQWFPSNAAVYDGMPISDRLYQMALPIATLVLATLGHMQRMTRAAILDLMSAPFIETARLKGLNTANIIIHHALPNAVAPIINVVMLNIGYLIVGVVLVEVVFTYPGIGQYFVDHVTMRDAPVIQACGLVFATVYIMLNLIADLVSAYSNPRIRHPR